MYGHHRDPGTHRRFYTWRVVMSGAWWRVPSDELPAFGHDPVVAVAHYCVNVGLFERDAWGTCTPVQGTYQEAIDAARVALLAAQGT